MIIGAILGAAAGGLLGGQRWRLVGAGLGAVAGALAEAPIASALTSGGQPPAQLTPSTKPLTAQPSITLVPGQAAVSYGALMNEDISIALPTGAAWTSGNDIPPSYSGLSAPIAWTYQGAGQVTLNWTTSDGQPQSTVVTLYTVG